MLMLRQVVGDSMQPSLRPGQLVLARRRRAPRLREVVIVKHRGIEKIKRIVDMAEDRVYVRGDNPSRSTDSRHYGWIAKQDIQGIVLWPRV